MKRATQWAKTIETMNIFQTDSFKNKEKKQKAKITETVNIFVYSII